MGGRNLLDTNIVMALFAHDSVVMKHLGEAEEVFIPSIVLGEKMRIKEIYGDKSETQRVGISLPHI